eukprot:4815299-Amphidinium_carterae.1
MHHRCRFILADFKKFIVSGQGQNNDISCYSGLKFLRRHPSFWVYDLQFIGEVKVGVDGMGGSLWPGSSLASRLSTAASSPELFEDVCRQQ